MALSRVILHADMDAFYASVEQRDQPELRGRPVIVGGIGNRGVVSAASYEVRPYGVRSGMPTVVARQRCPEAVVIRGDMKKYRVASRQIFEIFRRFTPTVEGISLDEAFLDITGSERLLGPPKIVGQSLRREVREETQLSVSIGIGPVKMVAKIASAIAKPDGLLEVGLHELQQFLDPLSVSRLWGVGPVVQERLGALGIRTIGDLARSDASILKDALGEWGLRIVHLARGYDVKEVTAYRDPVSMSEESTFEEDVSDFAILDRTITVHSEAVARRLRKSDFKARTIVLKIKLATRLTPGPRGYPQVTRQRTIKDPTDDGEILMREAQTLLRTANINGKIRLIGVGVTNLVYQSVGQCSLFESDPKSIRRQELNRALDKLNERFGLHTVERASAGSVDRQGLSFQIKRGETE